MARTQVVTVEVADLTPVRMLVVELTRLREYVSTDEADLDEVEERLERALTRFSVGLGEMTDERK